MSTIDSELLDLLRDRPELLRIATAVAETRPAPRRRRRVFRLALVAALVAVSVTIALVASFSGRGPNVVDRALAAIGTGPVIHAVVAYSTPNDLVVDLATGKSYERVHHTEYWYDQERSFLHTRLTTDGKMLTEIVETPTGLDSDLGHYPGGIAAQLDPALAGFVSHYREALASGKAKIVGHEQVDGRDVTLLRITLDHGDTEDVGIDSATYRPLFFRANPRPAVGIVGKIPTWQVAVIESVPRDPSYFAKPDLSPPRPTGGGGGGMEEITPDEAANALDLPALWVGARFSDLPLARIELEHVQTDYTDGSKHDGNKLELSYGEIGPNGRLRASQPWLIVGEAASVAASYQLGFNDGGDPPAPEGSMVVEDNSIFATAGRAIPERAEWTGKLIRSGMYVELSASSRELLLAAARALEPLHIARP